MIDLLFSNPAMFFLILLGIVIAIGIHEAAHAFMADYLGDPTPRSLGRTTLNPLAHLDPLGTLAIIITGGFGWGKPAPYDPYNLRDPRRDTMWIALAGPLSNILLALVVSVIARIHGNGFLQEIFFFLISLNINLALFNLLPVPPLDGSKIFLNRPLHARDNHLLLFLFILPLIGGVSLAALIISPISRFLLSFLLP